MKTIHVVIQGGVVQSISPIPEGVEVVVIDYDVEGVNPDKIEVSPLDQNLCVIDRYAGERRHEAAL